jgi:hypothetical protein
MINKGMEIAIREVNRRRRLTGEINQLQISLFKYCRDGKEANMLLYYITILKVLLWQRARTTHAIVHLQKPFLQVECGLYSSSNHKIH